MSKRSSSRLRSQNQEWAFTFTTDEERQTLLPHQQFSRRRSVRDMERFEATLGERGLLSGPTDPRDTNGEN